MLLHACAPTGAGWSLPVRGAWVEIHTAAGDAAEREGSLPVRGAWVEMEQMGHMLGLIVVAPRAGSVG